MTYQIIYSSVSSTPMQLDELEDILEHAQSSNASQGITGALVYADGYFLQILEGDADAVQTLMRRISKDLRHEALAVLQASEIAAPAFSDWKMAYVSATPQQVASWAGLGSTTKLPEIWEDMRQNPLRAAQVAESILSLLVWEILAPQARLVLSVPWPGSRPGFACFTGRKQGQYFPCPRTPARSLIAPGMASRRLHFIGTSIALGLVVAAVLTQVWWLLAVALVQGYAFAWVGHYFFEHNRPATFTCPGYSFMGDWRLWWDIVTGKIPF